MVMLLIPGHEVEGQRDFNYVPNYYNEPEYNCTIPRTVQGEWYSREKNLDTVTIIDATSMQHRGVCMQHKYDYGSNYTFLFGENPGKARTCYHCVLIFVRTVNIIEKKESKFKSHCLRKLMRGFNHGTADRMAHKFV